MIRANAVRRHRWGAVARAAGLAAFLGLSVFASKASAEPLTFNMAGSLKGTPIYEQFERELFLEQMPKDTNGEIKADLKSLTEMGLKGPEVLRLTGRGVVQMGSVLLGYNTGDEVALEGVDIAGLAPDVASARKVSMASLAFLKPIFAEKFGVELLAIGSNPGQMFFCNAVMTGLESIAGKKVRVNGKSPAALVEALGGTPVFMPFAEVIPGLQNKMIDCTMGGSLPNNKAHIDDVTTHMLNLAIGWGQMVYVANKPWWDGLTDNQRSMIKVSLEKGIHGVMWDAVAEHTQQGVDCSAGKDNCVLGVKGDMIVIDGSDADRDRLQTLAKEKFIPEWASRCGEKCLASFNETIGKAAGLIN
ncbi:hypothetical protein [Chelatococcus sp. YT9]|uniref:hypothetical protein n=2 Tax=unclassified Chelatococcus TaxID=2638111 RepID=UPI0020C17857|nr:hypothetical protein [Chelatococcus sp. YT9]